MSEITKFTGSWNFLSNFHEWEASFGGVVYPTSEHAFQAAKTLDELERAKIYAAKTPKAAKAMGRKVVLRSDWSTIKISVMLSIVRSKFSEFEEYKGMYLLATGDSKLIEGNYWHDNYWGNCYCGRATCQSSYNYLGRALETVRTEIRQSKHY